METDLWIQIGMIATESQFISLYQSKAYCNKTWVIQTSIHNYTIQ
jgi:hypothetical protein